jgi:hypothetical protein
MRCRPSLGPHVQRLAQRHAAADVHQRRGPRRDCGEDRKRPHPGLHMNTFQIFPGTPRKRGTDSKLIWPVRDSPGDFLPAAHKVLDLLEIRFRYQICGGVLPWRALVR